MARALTESLAYGITAAAFSNFQTPTHPERLNDASVSSVCQFEAAVTGTGIWTRVCSFPFGGPVRLDALTMAALAFDSTDWAFWTAVSADTPASGAWTDEDPDGWDLAGSPSTWRPTGDSPVGRTVELRYSLDREGLGFIRAVEIGEVVLRGAFYPWADFVGAPLNGTAPLTVAFTDLSQHDPDTWSWDFGDGSSLGTAQHPTHVYASPGTYTVSLTVTNDIGETTETKVAYVNVQDQGIALDVYRINPPGDSITFLATLDGAFDKAIRPVLNDVGSGQFSINRHDPNATAEILAQGNLVKVRIPLIDDNPIFAFFLEAGDFTLISTDEEGGENITFAGRGALAYWDWARWLAVSYVIPWWDEGWPGLVAGKPPAGSTGHLVIPPGTYFRYTINSSGKIASRTEQTTAGVLSAWTDHRQAFTWAAGTAKAGQKVTLVQLSSTGWDNDWLHPVESGLSFVAASSVLGLRPEFGDIGEADVAQWWDDAWGTPPGGTLGRVSVAAGTYWHYTVDVAHRKWTARDDFTTGGFGAWYDRRIRVFKAVAGGGISLSPITLVRISSGVHAGKWVRSSQTGVRDWQAKEPTGTLIPGKVLRRIFDEVQSADRPSDPLPLMTTDITETEDSDGNDWTSTPSLLGFTSDVGDSYLDTVGKIVATGFVDVEMTPDLVFRAYNEIGRDLTGDAYDALGTVRFVRGHNIADELRREMSGGGPVATFTQVVGDDGYAYAVLEDAATRVTRETSTRADNSDAAALAELGAQDLERRLIRSDAVGFAAVATSFPAIGYYLPGPRWSVHGAYWLGDLVILHTGTGEQDFDEAALRVAAITITEDESGSLVTIPELASPLGAWETASTDNRGGTSSGSTSTTGTITTGTATVPVDLSAYQEVSEKGIASGYAGLDSGTLVPVGQLPVGTASTEVAAGDHAHDLDALSDVTAPAPVDGDGILWDAGASAWINAHALTQSDVVAMLTPDIYACDSLTVIGGRGTIAAGVHTDLHAVGGTTVQINEVTGAVGYDVEAAFSGVDGLTNVYVHGYYTGNHTDMHVQLYNYTTVGWDTVATFPTGGSTMTLLSAVIATGADYFDGGGNAKVRFYHPTTGNATHRLYLDYLAISHSVGTTGGLALDDLTDVVAPTPDDQDVLTWDVGAGAWIAAPAPGAGSGDASGQFIAGWDGGGAELTAGKAVDIVAPFTGTITSWTLLADVSGSAVVDIATDTFSGYPTFTSIVAADPPTLATATKATGSALSGWSKSVTAGDILRFTLSSASTVTRLLCVLAYSRP